MNGETPVGNTGLLCVCVLTYMFRESRHWLRHPRPTASDLFSAGLLHLPHQQLDTEIKSDVYLGLKWLLCECQ